MCVITRFEITNCVKIQNYTIETCKNSFYTFQACKNVKLHVEESSKGYQTMVVLELLVVSKLQKGEK